MFVTGKEKEFRDGLREYIGLRLVTEEMLAEDIGINTATLIRFLEEKPIRKTTLLKVGQFLIERNKTNEVSL